MHKTRGRYTYPVKTASGKILTGPWMKSEEEFKQLDEAGMIYWTTGGDEQPYGKIYLSDSKGAIPNDFWGIEFGTNQRGSLEVEDLFKRRIFDFPKPVSLLKNLLNVGSNEDSIIVDFFSGSATTAHAVMQLNAEDGGKRRFIIVQLPEECGPDSEAAKAGYKNICEIGKERIRRAGEKIRQENAAKPGIAKLDTGFRVLKCDSSNMKDVFYNADETGQQNLQDWVDNIKEDRSALDLFFGCLVDWNLPLSLPFRKERLAGADVYFYDTDGDSTEGAALAACFETGLDENTIRAIAARKPVRAVFRDACFRNSEHRINVDAYFKSTSPDTEIRLI